MKKTVLFFMVIVLMMGACGCGMKTVTNERNNVVPFLQDKYEEIFTLVPYEIRSIDIPYDEAVCTNALGQKVRIAKADERLDSFYWRVGLLDLWNLISADIFTEYSGRLSRCASYLTDTATDFVNVENDLVNKIQ